MCAQLPLRSRRTMLRLTVLLVLLSRSRTAYVTTPTFADQFQQLYEKLEKFQPLEQEKSPHEKLYEKLEKLNSLTPKELTDEDEELLTAMQIWGRLDPDQLDGVEKDLQSIRDDDDAKSDRIVDGDDSDSDYNDGVSPVGNDLM